MIPDQWPALYESYAQLKQVAEASTKPVIDMFEEA